ncbi:minor capsid protein [uncultured Parvimonas sp.]|uniref:minor capsid protein n=1 Tax=uncultured Parvimonas sp. TaxID=747372 RepID=UPI0025963EDE|nr:minor capsid protein [uncultured Parvimonas sp.]
MKSNYWGKRLAKEYWTIYNDTSKYQKELIKMYKDSSEEILKELFLIANKCEENGVISRSEFYRGNHLKNLEKSINDELRVLGENVEDKGSKIILNAGASVISQTGKVLGIPLDYNKESAMRLMQVDWKGSNFSKRVWKNQTKLSNELNTLVKKGIATGRPPAQIAMELDKSMNSGLYNASRLVRTETMHHMNEVNLLHLKENGIKQVQEIVTLDERTSSTCKVHQNKIHDIEKAPILPRHPNCRCVLVPYVDAEKLTEEFNRREKEILDKYVDNNAENGYNINIGIDGLTPCLVETKTEKVVDTVISTANVKDLKLENWNFDWQKEINFGKVFKLTLENDEEIQGLLSLIDDTDSNAIYVRLVESAPHNLGINRKYDGVGGHLFAEACKQAIEKGFDAIYFDAKTNLIKHYENTLGAKLIGVNNRMILEGEKFYELFEKYYGKKDKR